MAENLEYVQKGFRILHPLMAAYIAQEMSREYKNGSQREDQDLHRQREHDVLL